MKQASGPLQWSSPGAAQVCGLHFDRPQQVMKEARHLQIRGTLVKTDRLGLRKDCRVRKKKNRQCWQRQNGNVSQTETFVSYIGLTSTVLGMRASIVRRCPYIPW